MKTDFKNFRHNINRARAVRGYSARELSIKAGLRTQKRIIDIEEGRGVPSLDEVCAICKTLGYSLDEMLYQKANLKISFETDSHIN